MSGDFEPLPGTHLRDAITELLRRATIYGESSTTFNGEKLRAFRDTTREMLEDQYERACVEASKRHWASPDGTDEAVRRIVEVFHKLSRPQQLIAIERIQSELSL